MKVKTHPAEILFDRRTHSLVCPFCKEQIALTPAELRKLAGMLMGSSTSARKALASAENGKMGGRFKNDDSTIGGIIAPATASRYVARGRAEYGDYIEGPALLGVYASIYGKNRIPDLETNPLYDPASRYRAVLRRDIPGRVDFYCLDYYRKRKET